MVIHIHAFRTMNQ